MRNIVAGARALAALALLALAAPAAPQTPEESAAIRFALERGRLLFEFDRAAWIGTDDMVARVPNFRNAGMHGYVVEREGNGCAVTFYGGSEDAPVAFYRGRVENRRVVGREVFPAASRPPLTPLQRRLVAARQVAAAANRRRPCGEAPFNVALVPPASADAPIDVYLMTPQGRTGEFPVGGHYRMTVGLDGRVSGERAFTNSCITLSGLPGNTAGLLVTHLLDPVPTEIHVFTAIAAGIPLHVGIAEPERIYVVTGEEIRLLDERRRPRRRRG